MATLSDLTLREEEILRLVLAGRTNKAFAAQISLSEKLPSFILIRSVDRPGRRRLRERIWAFSKA